MVHWGTSSRVKKKKTVGYRLQCRLLFLERFRNLGRRFYFKGNKKRNCIPKLKRTGGLESAAIKTQGKEVPRDIQTLVCKPEQTVGCKESEERSGGRQKAGYDHRRRGKRRSWGLGVFQKILLCDERERRMGRSGDAEYKWQCSRKENVLDFSEALEGISEAEKRTRVL